MRDDSITVTQHNAQQIVEEVYAMVQARLPEGMEFRLPEVFVKAVNQR